ncbi:hypothetical protein CHS0354_041682 [Potamilus streckersoni]|uniref:Zinc finger PHD-type domain-containing protein n=1 Tax=Potamilus streckersoni TaxID=2493646 RepID=A0AAE0SCT6_9BIVA|nr:hypothetical protein CHS0354_041682 [Potamilus streckersoni]
MVSGHYLKIAFVDGLKALRESIPRKIKQALRPKLQAQNESRTLKRKWCNICKGECVDNPKISQENSIACDICNLWFHFGWVGLTGNEQFIKRKNSVWKCQTCLMNTLKDKEMVKEKGRRRKSKI